MTGILIRRENRGADVDTEEDWGRGGSDASLSQRVPATTRNWRGEEGSSPGCFRNSVALPTPWFRSLASRTGRGYFPDVLSHLVCGPSLSLLLLCFLSISAEQEALNRLEKKVILTEDFPASASGKGYSCQDRHKRCRFDPGLGRFPGEGNRYPL